jgi:hypothetical protein
VCSVFGKINYGGLKQKLILGTGTAIWWVTEPHLMNRYITISFSMRLPQK